jgi:hypothetical protein
MAAGGLYSLSEWYAAMEEIERELRVPAKPHRASDERCQHTESELAPKRSKLEHGPGHHPPTKQAAHGIPAPDSSSNNAGEAGG